VFKSLEFDSNGAYIVSAGLMGEASGKYKIRGVEAILTAKNGDVTRLQIVDNNTLKIISPPLIEGAIFTKRK
jgi:hypothetical protein